MKFVCLFKISRFPELSHALLADWSIHRGNRKLGLLGNCHGLSFCSFLMPTGNLAREIAVTHRKHISRGKSAKPHGKRACVTTAISKETKKCLIQIHLFQQNPFCKQIIYSSQSQKHQLEYKREQNMCKVSKRKLALVQRIFNGDVFNTRTGNCLEVSYGCHVPKLNCKFQGQETEAFVVENSAFVPGIQRCRRPKPLRVKEMAKKMEPSHSCVVSWN